MPLEPAEREAVFRAAHNRFADLLDASGSDLVVDLDDDAYGNMLTVQMSALAAVDADARGLDLPSDSNGLTHYLLGHEREYWGRLRVPVGDMERTVLVAGLTHEQPYADGLATLVHAGVHEAGLCLDEHRACYPPRDDPAHVLALLQSDRLAGDFIAQVVPGNQRYRHTDPEAPAVVRRLLVPPAGKPLPSYAGRSMTGIVETARRWVHVGGNLLYPLLRECPALSLSTGSPLLIRLANDVRLPLDVLGAIERVLPTHCHVELDAGIAAIALVWYARRPLLQPVDRGSALLVLGKRLATRVRSTLRWTERGRLSMCSSRRARS
jgi:hypothetical protein